MSANPSHPYACVTVHSTKDPPRVVTFSFQVRVGLLWILSCATALTIYESFCYERDTMHRFYFSLCLKVVQLKEQALSTSVIAIFIGVWIFLSPFLVQTKNAGT